MKITQIVLRKSHKSFCGLYGLLQPDARTRTSKEKVSILRFPFLLEEDNVFGGDTPFRTYKGMRYHGGYSDHLPVLLELIVEE